MVIDRKYNFIAVLVAALVASLVFFVKLNQLNQIFLKLLLFSLIFGKVYDTLYSVIKMGGERRKDG